MTLSRKHLVPKAFVVTLILAVALLAIPVGSTHAETKSAEQKSTKSDADKAVIPPADTRASPVKCVPEEYCAVDFDSGKCVLKDESKAKDKTCTKLRE